jgi:hypothetical protein
VWLGRAMLGAGRRLGQDWEEGGGRGLGGLDEGWVRGWRSGGWKSVDNALGRGCGARGWAVWIGLGVVRILRNFLGQNS